MGSILGGQSQGEGTKVPQWAQDALGVLVRDPQDFWKNAGMSLGAGLFGDALQGMQGAPAGQLFGGLGSLMGPAMGYGQQFAGMGGQLGPWAAGQNAMLAQQMGMPSAGASAGFNAMAPGFLAASAPYQQRLLELLNGPASQPFQGRAANAALAQMANTGPQGDIYNRTADLLRPQVRSAFSARGLGSSGAAIREESNQMQQLADSFAQRAMQERIGLLGQAVGGEGANASMTSALAQQLAPLISGSLGGAQLPVNLFQGLQGGLGQGLQNIQQAAGLNLSPLQAGAAGLGLVQGGLGLPVQTAGNIYNVTRAPFLQMLQAAAGAAPLGRGDQYRGILGIQK